MIDKVESVGKSVAASKRLYSWGLFLNYKRHTIDLKLTLMSGKKQVFYDGTLLLEDAGSLFDTNFNRGFQFDGHNGIISVIGSAPNPKIGNKSKLYVELTVDGDKYDQLIKMTPEQIEKTLKRKKRSESDDDSDEEEERHSKKKSKHSKKHKESEDDDSEEDSEEERHSKKKSKHSKKHKESEDDDSEEERHSKKKSKHSKKHKESDDDDSEEEERHSKKKHHHH